MSRRGSSHELRSGGTGTPSGGQSSLRRLAPAVPQRSMIEQLLGPGTLMAALGSVLALAMALLPAPDRPEATPEERAVGQRVHEIRAGDNLRGLAQEYYSDPGEWRQIFLANREALIRNGCLKPGEKLVIPVFEVSPGDRVAVRE